jgi:hypothetical protein
MSKNRFEQLIEYVINDEEAKAKELFHQIVVEKSRAIYEDLMDEDNAMGMEPTEIDTNVSEESDTERDDRAERAGRKVAKDIEYDEKHGRYNEDMHGTMGGSQAQDMIDDVEMEEQGMSEDDMDAEFDDEAETAGKDMTRDMEDEHDDGELENRVVDLEDKLDELMAEFEAMMDGGNGADMGDTPDMTDIEVQDDEYETEGMMMPMEEAISLKQVHPKTTTQEAPGTDTKSTVAANSGARGAMAQPVKMTGDTAQGRPAPTTKDLIGRVGNSPAQGVQSPKAAPKPVTSQAAGVNTRTPFPKA